MWNVLVQIQRNHHCCLIIGSDKLLGFLSQFDLAPITLTQRETVAINDTLTDIIQSIVMTVCSRLTPSTPAHQAMASPCACSRHPRPAHAPGTSTLHRLCMVRVDASCYVLHIFSFRTWDPLPLLTFRALQILRIITDQGENQQPHHPF